MKEVYWIDYYKSYNTKHGLNMSIGGDHGNRKYKTKEEAKAALKKQRERYNTHKEIRERLRKYYNTHIDEIKEYHKERRRKRGILSWKGKFEKRYNLSRPLTSEEWNTWITDKSISGCHSKKYAIKYLKSLINITFTIPTKK